MKTMPCAIFKRSHKISRLDQGLPRFNLKRLLECTIYCVFTLSIVSCSSLHYPPPISVFEQPLPAEKPIVVKSENQVLVAQFEAGGLVSEETLKGVSVYLPIVMFANNSTEITSEALMKLQYIAKISNQGHIIKRHLDIEGHTNSIGTEQDNLELSKLRAIKSADELIKNGMDSDRMTIKWFGETRPRVPDYFSDGTPSPQGVAANRRVEFILLNP